jgi:D-alanyl-D-alanine carboxypeptidase
MLHSLILTGILVMAQPVWAQNPVNDPALAELAERARAESGAPAVGIMLWRAGDQSIGVAGIREQGEDANVTVDDLWHVGSNTKSMTATLVARLVEQGVISWDDTIGDSLGSEIETINPQFAPLNFRHLLSHRAGLVANVDMVHMFQFRAQQVGGRDMHAQRLDYAASVLSGEVTSTPGEAFLYSNAGYVVAAAMLEQITGESWEELLTREVFEPLGMTSAGFGPPGTAEAVDQPRGHVPGLLGGLSARTPGPTADNPLVMGPAGTVHASLGDMAKYLSMHLAGARGEDTEFLSSESWQILHTPPFGGDYAMGWGVRGDTLLHAGSNTMWLVQFILRPDEDLAIAVAFNEARMASLQPQLGQILDAIRERSD